MGVIEVAVNSDVEIFLTQCKRQAFAEVEVSHLVLHRLVVLVDIADAVVVAGI